jgi:hypothetical protein
MIQALAQLVPLGLEVDLNEVRTRLGFSEPKPGARLLRTPAAPIAQTGVTALAGFVPSQPRDDHGRWSKEGDSGAGQLPVSGAGSAPPSIASETSRARTLLAHALAGAWQKGDHRAFSPPGQADAERFSRLLATWNAASGLDDDAFHQRFARGLIDDPATLHQLRQTAAAQAQTLGQVIDASKPLAAALKGIGPGNWPGVMNGLEQQAGTAAPPAPPAPTPNPSVSPTSWIQHVGEGIWNAINPIGSAKAAGPEEETEPKDSIDAEYGKQSSRAREELYELNPEHRETQTCETQGKQPTEEDVKHFEGLVAAQRRQNWLETRKLFEELREFEPWNNCLKDSFLRTYEPTWDRLERLRKEVKAARARNANDITWGQNTPEGHGYEKHALEFGRDGNPCTRAEYEEKIIKMSTNPEVTYPFTSPN